MTDFFFSGSFYFFIIATYLVCSCPFGLVIMKIFYGIDIRQKGSGNIGMTNVMRVKGKLPGIATFVLDFFKGYVCLIAVASFDQPNPLYLAIVGFVCVFAHTRSIFLRFQGGKGVATHLAVWLFFHPLIFVVLAVVWLATYAISKYSSLSALVSLIINPISVFVLFGAHWYFYLSILLSLYIILLHKDNIQRLIKGEEKKMSK